ncbi:fimbrial biogenesis outer membrane usher protein [Leclercia sp. LTM01]|uniref:Fimbrial biogenesis outer membrane usher protein n=1 Tax=Leclercia barmai TaxID=2785629 RepID=A0ABS7RS76_9ENTR|nr:MULTISPECIES: fimbria/pilus outer membrane usher protein [unclassified Leclercia]MBZ0057122.1 fimbrial biogenesis outer membrane usher protein [Leclercia sp. EMC7]MCM5695297.1 fimbrial biogenesis outer membrane usher protein [Leclercia sp. LTM01]
MKTSLLSSVDRFSLVIFTGALTLSCGLRQAQADDYFDPHALEITSGQQQTSDLSWFSRQGGQKPGRYKVSVFVNQTQVDERELEFIQQDAQLVPALDAGYLSRLGVNTGAFPAFQALHKGDTFSDPGKFIPDAAVKFDFAAHRLDFSIPQAAMRQKSRGFIPPEQWDEGIPAAFVDYNLTGSTTNINDIHDSDSFLSLRSGFNLGPWRVRNASSVEYGAGHHWQTQGTSVKRAIKRWKSELMLGDGYTSGDVFDSFQFTGMQLASDENMLPDSERGFAPTIRGIAHSNARITVRQHGYIIYETYVAPGAFVINDLFPTAQSGDLDITIRESDGSERNFTQPWSAVPFMLREGRVKFSASAGKFTRPDTDGETPAFIQASAFYGLPSSLTLYGGAQLSNHYQALAIGVGKDFGQLGALGIDTLAARAQLTENRQGHGQQLRAQYHKNIATTDTSLDLFSNHYTTRDFYSFSEANNYRDPDQHIENRRHRIELSLTQDFGGWGNISASFYRQKYWNSSAVDQTVHVGYYANYKGISWSLGYYLTRSSSDDSDNERSVNLSVSVPLSRWLPGGTTSYSLNNNLNGHTTQQVSLYGTALSQDQLSYNIQQGFDNQAHVANSNLALAWHGGSGSASIGYSHDRYNDRLNYGAAGGIVATQYGVTLSQSLGDTIGLIRAEGAPDVQIEGATNVHTDSRGYAVMPTLSAYHKNTLSLDTETLADEVDLEQNSQTVVPTSGAVVLANYHTHVGVRTLITLTWQGRPLPFGANAFVSGAENATSSKGIVGDGGQVYLSGVPLRGVLHASWRQQGQTVRCSAPITLPAATEFSPVRLLVEKCD